MASSRSERPHLKWKDYQPTRLLGRGGNGEVWLCRSKSGAEAAVKFLTHLRGKRYHRFRSEISILQSLNPFPGVVPILDQGTPTTATSRSPAWYAMPVGTSAWQALGTQIEEIAGAMLQIAYCLVRLHAINVFHRDIKPDNILRIDGAWCLSDFGLAEWPGAEDLTEEGESIGPRWTIAPEMRRQAHAADAAPADTYSLAKTLWVLLTGQRKGFDGQYDRSSESLSLSFYCKDEYLGSLHSLLEDCTRYDPGARPSMRDFHARLSEWLKARSDFHARCLLEWKYMQQWLFPQRAPRRAIWVQSDDIATVLNEAVATRNLNHCFFPSYGGLDLKACRSIPSGLLELDFGVIHIIKPKLLEVVLWPEAPEWSYFWLELDSQESSGIYEDLGERDREELVELPNGTLLDRSCWDENSFCDEYGDLRELPSGARLLVRYFRGAFVIFAKRSPYNLARGTYDAYGARHNRLGREGFFDYIRDHVERARRGMQGVSQVNPVK